MENTATPHTSHHMKYWGSVKDNAEKCVKNILEGGNHPVTLRDVIGKDCLENPEDWDGLMTFCKHHGAVCHDINKLFRASASWLQAYHELEYKRLYP